MMPHRGMVIWLVACLASGRFLTQSPGQVSGRCWADFLCCKYLQQQLQGFASPKACPTSARHLPATAAQKYAQISFRWACRYKSPSGRLLTSLRGRFRADVGQIFGVANIWTTAAIICKYHCKSTVLQIWTTENRVCCAIWVADLQILGHRCAIRKICPTSARNSCPTICPDQFPSSLSI